MAFCIKRLFPMKLLKFISANWPDDFFRLNEPQCQNRNVVGLFLSGSKL